MNEIKKLLTSFTELSANSIEKLTPIFSEVSYKKDSNIGDENQKDSKIFFVKEGICSSYLTNTKGKHFIRTLFIKNDFIVTLAAFINKTASNVEYKCLTDCTFYTANYDQFLKIVNENHDISKLYIQLLENSYSKLLKRVTNLTTVNATERYLKLKKRIPNIENLIPQYQIAYYLSITPVQLSRIRKELYSK